MCFLYMLKVNMTHWTMPATCLSLHWSRKRWRAGRGTWCTWRRISKQKPCGFYGSNFFPPKWPLWNSGGGREGGSRTVGLCLKWSSLPSWEHRQVYALVLWWHPMTYMPQVACSQYVWHVSLWQWAQGGADNRSQGRSCWKGGQGLGWHFNQLVGGEQWELQAIGSCGWGGSRYCQI